MDNSKIKVNIFKIPKYLHKSILYQCLDFDILNKEKKVIHKDKYIFIPPNTFKSCINVRDNKDLDHLLSTLRFWGISTIPTTIIDYIFAYNDKKIDQLFPLYKKYKDYLNFFYIMCIKVKEPYYRLAEAADRGCLKILKYLRKKYNYYWTPEVCEYAARKGHLDILKYVHEHDSPWLPETCSEAILHGHFNCFKYAHENGCKLNADAGNFAAYTNNLNCLKYLYQYKYHFSEDVCGFASQTGSLECLEFIYNHNLCRCKTHNSCIANAATQGKLACMKLAYQYGNKWHPYTCTLACTGGFIDCLKYAHENGCAWDTYECCKSALNGHLECLEYAHQHGAILDTYVAINAACGGSLDCLKYAYKNNAPMSEEVCVIAASYGHLDCLEYVHQHGVHMNSYACYEALVNGNWSCLLYCYRNGCYLNLISIKDVFVFLYKLIIQIISNGYEVYKVEVQLIGAGSSLLFMMFLLLSINPPDHDKFLKPLKELWF